MAVTLPLAGWPWIVSIHLFSELNGISKILAFSGLALRARAASGPPWTSEDARKMATSVGEPVKPPGASASGRAAVFKAPQRTRASTCWRSPVLYPHQLGFKHKSPSSPPPADGAPSDGGAGGTGGTKSVAVILPEVSVPVLSLQRTPTQPRVSTASTLRTRTLRRAMCCEAIMRHTVTVGSKPSGTCAKKAVAAFSKTSAKLRFWGERTLATSDSKPTPTATKAIKWTKCSIWISSVDFT
mmetsp:Transcript_88431/g.255040  ORF Transcript_88431/g.255040 Transcript_88431/m.255040 type:complete len:241 (-) Transcript_88431:1061-1783(-)